MLELLLVGLGLAEAAASLGIKTGRELTAQADRLMELTGVLTGMDPLKPLLAVLENMPPPPPPPPDANFDFGGTMREAVVESFGALVQSFPARRLETAAREAGEVELAHRIHIAWERLNSTLLRYLPAANEKLLVLGRAYAEGRLEIDELSGALGVPVPDVVAELQRLGLARAGERIALAPEREQARLEAIANSLPRSVTADAELVQRDVVASQRLEDVDARPWLRPGKG